MDILAGLNIKQAEAVLHLDGPALIIAGAGSGKTRVLTHRIANLILSGKARPEEIFAVTFTNKAAAEMRHRVVNILNDLNISVNPQTLWVSTFHSACVRMLRTDIRRLGYNPQFSIYDDSDQLSVIKGCLKEFNISENAMSPKSIQHRIHKEKHDGHDVESYPRKNNGPHDALFDKVFRRYTEVLKQSSALDFSDIILLVVQLLQDFPDIREAYQRRWKYVMIDEYQDTNKCQYMLVKLLAGDAKNICAVGDEDQSIYRWRGADIRNILAFEEDFQNTKLFKLEQNYRSTKNIIEAASVVISRNSERREKTLWTANVDGDLISLIEAYDEQDESDKVVHDIANKTSSGVSLNELAIFYRTNAQSRVLEDRLRNRGLAYQIFGGLKFYDRLEIKDALAYIKLIVNPADDVSFRRIINVPTRGIGAVSLKKLTDRATEMGVSHYQLLKDIMVGNVLDVDLGRARKNFDTFYKIMEDLHAVQSKMLPSDLLNYALDTSGYKDSLISDPSPEARSRLENLAELRQGMVEYELRCGAENPNEQITIAGFLEQVALVSDIDRLDPNAPTVKLMTIHMAKGLEFDNVYIVGLEEELFPNIRAWEGEDTSDVEEERRLFYVGMTRARTRLTLLTAKNRTVFGTTQFRVMSRFLEEIPKKYLEFKQADYFSRRKHYMDRPLPPRMGIHTDLQDVYSQVDEGYEDSQVDGQEDGPSIRPGVRVEHPLFGRGVVRQKVGMDKVMVDFSSVGLKKISLKFGMLRELGGSSFND